MRTFLRNFLIAAALPLFAHAQPGDPDRSYGNNGVAIVDFAPLSGGAGNVLNSSTAIDAQGRAWTAVLVQGASGTGLGLSRLTGNGHLDTSFGNGGLVFAPLPPGSYSLMGLRMGTSGVYVAYNATLAGDPADTAWYACRIANDGSFDATFFGGCAGVVPSSQAVGTDLAINPLNGHVWIVGDTPYTDPPNDLPVNVFNAPTVVEFDPDAEITRSVALPQDAQYVDLHMTTAKFDSAGTLLVGGYANAYYPVQVTFPMMWKVTRSGPVISIASQQTASYSGSGYGRCIATLFADSTIVMGLDLAPNNASVQWATFSLRNLAETFTLDTTYGNHGQTIETIGDTQYTQTLPDFALHDCTYGTDDDLTMVGSYRFHDPSIGQDTIAFVVHRLHYDGTADQSFGGEGVKPGIGRELAFAGTAFDYARPLTPNVARRDVATRVDASALGVITVSGYSQRTDGSTSADAVVMRIKTDDIFNDAFQ